MPNSIMGFRQYRNSGVHHTIRCAIDVIERRGIARNMHFDRETGNVDVEGAFYFALGASGLPILVQHPEDVLPRNLSVLHDVIMELVAGHVGLPVHEWSDATDQTEIVASLRKLADQIEMSTV